MMFVLFFAVAFATKGVDYSTAMSTSTQSCFVSSGYKFAIPRCFRSLGSTDPNCKSNIANAHSAGMSRVDAYFFPCYSCGNVAGQVSTFWDYTVDNKLNFKRLWFDIEGTWSSSSSTNQNFLMQMVNQARSIGIVYGIYSSQHYWTSFFGSSYKFQYASSIPIWYAHYDNSASFSDFTSGGYSFGGWSTPNTKQYKGDTTLCSASVDFNYEK